MKRELRIWINDDDVYEYETDEIKPSEMITMGVVLQEAGLKMMGMHELNFDKEEE